MFKEKQCLQSLQKGRKEGFKITEMSLGFDLFVLVNI
jgi:hypothetical protein